jgi:ATP-dependent helicase/nuclease subunit B
MREEDDPTAMDLGNLYHEALRKIVTATLREKLDWANLPEKLAHDLVWNCTEEVGKELRQELMISSARNRHLLGWIGRTLEKITAGQRAAARRGQFRPALAEMVFGSGGRVPALTLTTPKGNRLDLRGKIDRVDLHRTGHAFSVIDYKTSSKKLELDRVWHGLSLQLLIYMLVIQEHGEKIWGKKAEAAAGLYVELLRRLQSVKDPADEIGPDDPRFDLRVKPRGVVREDFLQSFDEELVPGQYSDVLPVRMNKDGSLSESSTDVLRGEDIEALLNYVREKVAELADRILEGAIEAQPYRLGTETPCALCDYRSICRFQPGLNRYLHVQHMNRNSVLEQLENKSRGEK